MSATLPEGFELDAPSRGAARLPPGFELDDRNGSSADDGSGVSVEIGPKKSKKGNVERTVGVAATGFNKGLAEFAGLPVDIATGALNLIPRGINAVAGTALPTIEKPFLGSEHIKALMSGAAMLGDEPETPVEKLLAGTFGEIGANVLPTGLMMRAGQKGAGAVRAVMPPTPPTPPLPPQMLSVPSEAGSALGNAGTAVAAKLKNLTAPGMWESLVAPARTAPGAFAVEQNLIAGGAGLGGSAAEQLVGETENPYVQTGAKILGSLVGGLAPVGGLAAGRMLGEAIPVTEQQKRMAAARMLGIKPEMQLNLNAAAEAAPSIPGASYTAADLLNDQKLLAAQRGNQRLGDDAVAAANQQRVTNANAYRNFAADEAPGGDVTRPKAAATEKVQEIAARRAEAIDQAGRDAAEAEGLAAERGQRAVQMATRASEGNVAAARADAMQPLGDGVPADVKAAASERARDAIVAEHNSQRAQAGALYNKVDPDRIIRADPAPLRQAISRVEAGQTERFEAPDALPKFMTDGRAERIAGGPLTYEQLKNLRSTLLAEARADRQGMTPNLVRARNTDELVEGIEQIIRQIENGGASDSGVAVLGAAPKPVPARSANVSQSAPTRAYTPNGTGVDVEYEIRNLSDLIASHNADGRPNAAYPAEIQPRDRSRLASEEQVSRISRELNPELLGPSALASDGAPIISRDGVVESGNGRVMALGRAYDQGLPGADRYRQWLIDQGYPVEGMDRPVLVRRRTTELTPEERAQFARDANRSTVAKMGRVEQAVADAKSLPDNLLERYAGGELDTAANAPFVRSFMNAAAKSEEGGMMTAEGRLSQEGAKRIEAAILAKAYGDEDLLRTTLEATDNNIRAMTAGLTDAAPEWAKMRAAVRNGDIPAEMDITDDLLRATKEVRDARRQGMTVADRINQTDAFAEKLSPNARSLLEIAMGEDLRSPASSVRLARALEDYAAEAQKNFASARLFADEPAVSAGDILGVVKGRVANGKAAGTRATARDIEPNPGAGNREDGASGGRPGPDANRTAPAGILEGYRYDPEVGARYRLANAFFKENVVDRFRKGTMQDILARGQDGLPKVAPSDTLKKVVNPASAKPEAVDDFVRAVGGREDARKALLDYAVADIADFARNAEGHLVSSKLQAWREKHAPVLRAFPEVDRVLSNVQGLQRRVDSVVAEAADRIARAETLAKADLKAAKETGKQKVAAEKQRASETQKQIDRSAAKFWIDKEPGKAVASVLSSGDPVKAAKQTLAIVNKGGAEAKRGVAQAAWDYALGRMFSNVEGEGLKVATTAKFLEKNRDALRILLGGDGQLKKLEDLYRAAEINSRTGRANVRGGSDTAQNQASRNQKVVDAAKRSFSSILGAGTGATFGGTAGALLGGAAGATVQGLYERQRDMVRQLAGAALHDPEVFRTLTTAVTAANEKALAARLRGHIATLGLRQAEENSARP